MANPTTNYSFVLPTSTDLVTDLPADFDIALQGVDTRLKALQPGTTSGDLAYSSATANTNVRLPIGTAGQVLAVVAGVPAWSTTADQTPLTTKGDLFTFTTTDARLGVGANGESLVADSLSATGLKYEGAWTAYTPTTSNMTVGNGTLTARHCKVGKLCTVKISFRLGSTSTIGTIPSVSLPFSASVPFGAYQVFGALFDAGTADFTGVGFLDASALSIFVLNSASTFLAPAVVNATTPMVWTTNDYFQFIFSYEVA